MTNREKIAWAKRHRVVPPAFVVEAARKERAADRVCCHEHHEDERQTACASDQATKHSCCDEPSGANAAGRKPSHDRGKTRVGLVLVESVRKCQGISPVWTLLGMAVPTTARCGWSFDWLVVGSVREERPTDLSVSLAPPVPPPKLSGRAPQPREI